MNDSSALTHRGRLLLAACGVAAVVLLATARGLNPDPRGFGTHEQLGLSACGFTRLTGWRCPTCGMTTSWSHAARGNVRSALAASGGGTVLYAVTLLAAPWAMASAIAGRWLGGRPRVQVLLGIGGAWLTVTVLDWVRRLVAS
ncbi:MAG: DUF2752 domain-containing protein [Pirellulales bacterium]|nr:DUF2752 domain-containing protein [Pirellulales bacterium]